MAENQQTREYMECIKKHKNFKPDGELDEAGFYNQLDGSFFDPGGYYFNSQGYDEFGGYYDENGQYHEEGMGDHEYQEENEDFENQEFEELAQNQLIEDAEPNTVFEVTMKSLPFDATQKQIEEELKKKGIKVTNIALKHDQRNRLVQVDLLIQGKESAKALSALTSQKFLGRSPKIYFNIQEDLLNPVLLSFILETYHTTTAY